MEIRRMLPGEEDEVSKIYATSWKEAYKGIVPQPYLDALPENRWSSKLAGSAYRSCVILDKGSLIGTSSYAGARDRDKAGMGEIISIYLLPRYWGQGYGKPLIEYAIRELTRMGFHDIYLWVLEENSRARRFYERSGFTDTGETKVLNVGGKDLTERMYIRRGQ